MVLTPPVTPQCSSYSCPISPLRLFFCPLPHAGMSPQGQRSASGAQKSAECAHQWSVWSGDRAAAEGQHAGSLWGPRSSAGKKRQLLCALLPGHSWPTPLLDGRPPPSAFGPTQSPGAPPGSDTHTSTPARSQPSSSQAGPPLSSAVLYLGTGSKGVTQGTPGPPDPQLV